MITLFFNLFEICCFLYRLKIIFLVFNFFLALAFFFLDIEKNAMSLKSTHYRIRTDIPSK